MRTRKVKAAGKLGVKYGLKVRERVKRVEEKQRKKQKCPFCSKVGVKRLASGIWHCPKCNKKFAGDAYYLS